MPLSDDPAHRAAIRATAIRRALAWPRRYLAAPLAAWTDADLAAELHADLACVWWLRLCNWPRAFAWEHDVERLAALVGADAPALDALLRCCGVAP